MGLPAARLTDLHLCPLVTGPVPHVGGPVTAPGAPTVLIGALPAARATDMCSCVGPPDMIAKGSPTVLTMGLPQARVADTCAHGGAIVMGCFTVLVGEAGGGGGAAPPAGVAPPGTAADAIAKSVNPGKGTINCGNIVDAVIARLDGTDPNAVAPTTQDGTFAQIEARHGASLAWGHTLQDAYDATRDAGPGAVAIVGIDYGNGASHVVVMTNQAGTVSLIEGQLGGRAITDPAVAQAGYQPADVGYGLVPPRGP